MDDAQDVEIAVQNPIGSGDTGECDGDEEGVDFWTIAEREDDTGHGHDDTSRHHISNEVPVPSSSLAPSDTHDWELLWDLGDVDKDGYLTKPEFEELFASANGLSLQKRPLFDFTASVPIVENANVNKLWEVLQTEQEGDEQTVSKAAFLETVMRHEDLFDTLYMSHLTHEWEDMWDESDTDGSGFLTRDEVLAMFRLANERDHAGTSTRIITYSKMRELWLQMAERSGVDPETGNVTREAFLYSVQHNPKVYGTVCKTTHEKRLQDSVATALVGAGSAVTMMMLVYTAVSTRALAPLLQTVSADAANNDTASITGTSIVAIVAFVVGLPAYVFFKISQRSELVYAEFASVEQMRFKLQWGWIYTRYRPQVWWWEAKVIFQKLLTSTVVTVYAEDPERALTSLAWFQVFFILFQLYYRPYSTANENYSDLGLMSLEALNMIFSGDASEVIELVLLAANAVPVVMLLLAIKHVNLKTVVEKLRMAGSRLLTAVYANMSIMAAVLLMSILAAASVVLASQSTEECVQPILAVVATASVLAVAIPGFAYLMNSFQKWMVLNHSVDNHAKDVLEHADTVRKVFRKLAILGAVMSHLQLTRLQFSLDIEWPPALLHFIRAVTSPFAFDLDLEVTFESFCFERRLKSFGGELFMLLLITASLGLCSIAIAYWPNRHAVHAADAADMVEHEKNKKRLHDEFIKLNTTKLEQGHARAKSILLDRVCMLGMLIGIIGGVAALAG